MVEFAGVIFAKLQFQIASIEHVSAQRHIRRSPGRANMSTTAGLHHITAMAGDPRRNVAFYTEGLGLRMIKKTVNFDDPGTYHLYYGDEAGTPGTIMTFFPWAHARPGRRGAGEASETAFAVPPGTLPFWQARFTARGVTHEPLRTVFGETVLSFNDPDGMSHQLVETPSATGMAGHAAAGVPATHAIRGFAGVTLHSRHGDVTGAVLEMMGYERQSEENGLTRYQSRGSQLGNRIDVRHASGETAGQMGAGTIHHIAFRAEDDAAQAEMASRLTEAGAQVTEQRDRQYFRSVYFREPGGVLFEIATDAPGFAIDEAADALGTQLMLPKWLETRRTAIETALPPLE
jgi:glyoxalase family protein